MFIFFRTGERVELPGATSTMLTEGRFRCLDSAGSVIKEFPAELVVMFSFQAWDVVWEAINKWSSAKEENGRSGSGSE
jgi:hypothetical protein